MKTARTEAKKLIAPATVYQREKDDWSKITVMSAGEVMRMVEREGAWEEECALHGETRGGVLEK